MSEKPVDTGHQLLEHFDDPAETQAERAAEVTVETKTELARAEHEQQQQIVEARQAIEQTETINNPLEQLKADQEPSEAPHSGAVSKQLEKIALQRELKNLRRKLPAPQRALSKLVHQPVVRATSEAAAKTVSRPSGLLGGGLLAFAGSLVYLYLAKHIGFRYNYLLFVLLFLGGFVLGVCLELGIWLASRQRKTD